MSAPLLEPILLIVALTAWGEWRLWRRRERAIRAAEAQYEAEFDLTAAADRLEEYVELLCRVLPPATLCTPAVTQAPSIRGGTAAQARSAVDFAARRFGLVLPPFEVSFTPHLASDRAGEVCWDEPWELLASPDQIIIRPCPGRERNWHVRLREDLRHDPERLAVVAAHEVAHVALLSRGVTLTPDAENEMLTDAAAVLVGFGPLMERTAFRVRRHPRSGRSLTWTVGTSGYLHRGAIRHLSARREALASSDSSVRARCGSTVT